MTNNIKTKRHRWENTNQCLDCGLKREGTDGSPYGAARYYCINIQMTKEEAERLNSLRKYPVLRSIFEDGRLSHLRYFLEHNKFEEEYRCGFSWEEAMYIITQLEKLEKLEAIIKKADD